MRVRAAAASSRISVVNPWAVSAAAARCRRGAGAGAANKVAGAEVVMVSSWAGRWCGGVFFSAVRQRNTRECEATRQPHIPVRCLVGPVRADATEGAGDTMTTPSGPGHGRPDPGLSAIMGERRQLINLTYRLLGSLAEAEDVVQETYAR
jgi:hypothetical protein